MTSIYKSLRFVELSLLTLTLTLGLSSCGVYSFSGAALSPSVKTISISNFGDRSGTGPASLAQTFTNKARQYFQSNSTLTMVPSSGDLQMEGNIVGYTYTPIAATGADQAAKTRLTITVQLKYSNLKEPDQDFDQQFSSFLDYDQRQNLTPTLENSYIETISNQILLDIYQKSVANW
jgi:hypothetical protein